MGELFDARATLGFWFKQSSPKHIQKGDFFFFNVCENISAFHFLANAFGALSCFAGQHLTTNP